jgi:hypothetical protein
VAWRPLFAAMFRGTDVPLESCRCFTPLPWERVAAKRPGEGFRPENVQTRMCHGGSCPPCLRRSMNLRNKPCVSPP